MRAVALAHEQPLIAPEKATAVTDVNQALVALRVHDEDTGGHDDDEIDVASGARYSAVV